MKLLLRRGDRSLAVMAPLALALLGSLVIFLLGGGAGLFVPTSLELGEPYVVSASWFLSQGGSLYAPVTQEPFLHNNYNPLLQSLLAPVMSLSGPSFLPFRLVSILSSIGALFLIGLTVRRESGSRLGWLAGLLPLTSGLVFNWYFLARVDAFAWFLATWGGFVAFKHRDSSARKRAWFLVPALAAFAAKQSMIGTTGAVLGSALLRGRRREAYTQAGVFFLGCCVILALNAWLSDGQSWFHTILYNAGHQRAALLGRENLGRLLSALRLPMVILFASSFYFRRARVPWMVWVAFTLPPALWMASKSGSHVHYYHEMMTGMAIAVGMAMTSSARSLPGSSVGRRLAVGLVCTMVLVAWIPGAHRDWQIAKRYLRESGAEAPVPAELRTLLREDPRPALLLGSLADDAIVCGRPALFDMADFVRLQDAGRFDPRRDLFPSIAGHRFSVIGFPKWGHPVSRYFQVESFRDLVPAVGTYYRLFLETPRGRYYVPRKW